MPYDPHKHHRRSIRLRGYDYAQAGSYFVTICAYQRECLFGSVTQHTVRLSAYGGIVAQTIDSISNRFNGVVVDANVVMPDHVHAIIVIPKSTPTAEQAKLGQIVAFTKYTSTRDINALRGTPGAPVWQRNYHEHIIRDERALDAIRAYIKNNPAQWVQGNPTP